jgi:hypothetical protein
MLRVCGFDALASNVKILTLYFYADELATKIGAGDSSCAAAHEGVENRSIRHAHQAF